MEVTDAHGVRCPPGDAQHLRGRPGADAGDGAQYPLRDIGRGRRLDSRRVPCHDTQEIRAAAFDAHGVEAEVGQLRDGRRSWLKPEARRARCALAVPVDERTKRLPCFHAGHLLLEDRRDERVEQAARAWQPQPGVMPNGLAHDPMRPDP